MENCFVSLDCPKSQKEAIQRKVCLKLPDIHKKDGEFY